MLKWRQGAYTTQPATEAITRFLYYASEGSATLSAINAVVSGQTSLASPLPHYFVRYSYSCREMFGVSHCPAIGKYRSGK